MQTPAQVRLLALTRGLTGALRLAAVLLGAGLAGAAQAQVPAWPAKAITFVVPYVAGGNVDISTRILQTALGDTLGRPIIVENRAGAGGFIAGEYVMRAAPDGHTILIGANGPIYLGPMTVANPPYHWAAAFAAISGLAIATNTLVVRPTLPVSTLAELITHAKANPGKLTLATSSGVSINHFMGELLKLRAGVSWAEVHYRGNAPAVNDLVASHVDLGLQQLVDTLQHIQAGKLKVLAVLGPKRADALPHVPTIAEQGYPDVQGITWNGLFAPKATPREIVDRLSEATRKALASPAVKERLAAVGSEAHGSTPEQFARFITEEEAKWRAVIKEANIKVHQ